MTHTIKDYVAEVQRLNDDMHAREYPDVPSPIVYVEPGNRHHCVLLSDTRSDACFVHSFVDVLTGDIVKASGWVSRPSVICGNISDLTRGFGPYGGELQ